MTQDTPRTNAVFNDLRIDTRFTASESIEKMRDFARQLELEILELEKRMDECDCEGVNNV